MRYIDHIKKALKGLSWLDEYHELVVDDYLQRHLFENPRYADPTRLNCYEFHAHSQHGEDGILREIFRRIGTTSRTFVEFGVEHGMESNTAYLLMQGWRGMWLESNRKSYNRICSTFAAEIRGGNLAVRNVIVTPGNINQLLETMPDELDILSIDIDSNDYWVWQAATRAPRVVVIEYNAMFPPDHAWTQAYGDEPIHGTSWFGASLKALELLGKEKGYALVGCDFSGANAFFIRQELAAGRFHEPFTAEEHYQPARYFIGRRRGHPRGWRKAAVPSLPK